VEQLDERTVQRDQRRRSCRRDGFERSSVNEGLQVDEPNVCRLCVVVVVATSQRDLQQRWWMIRPVSKVGRPLGIDAVWRSLTRRDRGAECRDALIVVDEVNAGGRYFEKAASAARHAGHKRWHTESGVGSEKLGSQGFVFHGVNQRGRGKRRAEAEKMHRQRAP